MIKIQKYLKEYFELLWKSKLGLTNQPSWGFLSRIILIHCNVWIKIKQQLLKETKTSVANTEFI